ncbi:hypothetical protein [Marinimicrobium agarilyticum]|uniref:hypothetical protein n=1 Tax=Marinimicrobium agarilyticum TaxID=306546 RepID=UPI00040A581A|nr:hypothetical protein [Marinimicrobium agarilyticum]
MVLWDPNRDHDARRYEKPADFFRALKKCHASGKGYRVALTPPKPSPDMFEDWCAALWAVLDGHHLTYAIAEEYGAVCRNAGGIDVQRDENHYLCWTQGRKFGLVWQATSQRPQSISKDALENAGIIYAGSMGTLAAKRVGAEIEVDAKALRATQRGNFWYWDTGMLRAEERHIFTPDDSHGTEKKIIRPN